MNIFFYPSNLDSNSYSNLIIEALETNEVNVVNKDIQGIIKTTLKALYLAIAKKTKIFHFNWIESRATHYSFRNVISCNLLIFWLVLLKMFGAKLVWTMHNRKPHDCNNRKFSESIYKRIINKMDLIVIHCKESDEILKNEYNVPNSKIVYFPHGNYISNLKYNNEVNYKNKYNIQDDDFVYLYFGSISKYKNIPLLIEAFLELNIEKSKLLICGNSKDEEYIGYIKSLVSCDKRIILDIRFIDDKELKGVFNVADIVVLPYDKESMLNSGVTILAASLRKPIIVPEFGYIKDIKEKSFIFSYDYNNIEDHRYKLIKKMKESYNIKLTDSGSLKSFGESAYKFALNDLDWIQNCKKLIKEYEKLIK